MTEFEDFSIQYFRFHNFGNDVNVSTYIFQYLNDNRLIIPCLFAVCDDLQKYE